MEDLCTQDKASTAITTKSSKRLLGRIGDETFEVPKSTAHGNAMYVASCGESAMR